MCTFASYPGKRSRLEFPPKIKISTVSPEIFSGILPLTDRAIALSLFSFLLLTCTVAHVHYLSSLTPFLTFPHSLPPSFCAAVSFILPSSAPLFSSAVLSVFNPVLLFFIIQPRPSSLSLCLLIFSLHRKIIKNSIQCSPPVIQITFKITRCFLGQIHVCCMGSLFLYLVAVICEFVTLHLKTHASWAVCLLTEYMRNSITCRFRTHKHTHIQSINTLKLSGSPPSS